jgi:hypothetical protein
MLTNVYLCPYLKRSRIAPTRHHPALAARAFEFTILTTVRTSEAIGAKFGKRPPA